jgi:transcriptional regulator with XRE-family HTH domain
MVQLTRLKQVRQRKALTQQQLAEKAGVNRATVARLEGGSDAPSPTTVRKLADALGVQPEDLQATFDAMTARHLLQEQPDLAWLVREAADQLSRYFPDLRLSLELLADPDYGDGDQLFLGVATSLQAGEALKALRRFDEEWWVHHVGRARGLLCIDLRDD